MKHLAAIAVLALAGAAGAQSLDRQAAAERQAQQLTTIDKAWADKARAEQARLAAPAPRATDNLGELEKIGWLFGGLAAALAVAGVVAWFKVRGRV